MKVTRLAHLSESAQVGAYFGEARRDALHCLSRAKHAQSKGTLDFYRQEARTAGRKARMAWQDLLNLEAATH